MKVEFFQTVEVNGHATISMDQIELALTEAMNDASDTCEREDTTDRQKTYAVHSFANSIYQCLTSFPDFAIARATEEGRAKMAEALRKQADRWEPEGENDDA